MERTVSSYVLNRRDYYADFVIVPAATTVAVCWLLSLHIFNPVVFVGSAFVGLFSWTFVEYAMHRWFFHGFGSEEHRFHHIRPGEFIGFTPITTAIIGAITFWFLTVSFGPLVGVGLLVGLVVGYLFYLFVHDKIHHGSFRRGTYLAKLNANHDYHHFRFRVNYGVVTPLWDYLFGTFQQNPARPMNER